MKENLLIEQISQAISLVKEITNEDFSANSDDLHSSSQSYVQQLEEWRELWSTSHFVIGIIGITSSGKSTVINAMLGKKILVSRVKPSSSVIIECSWGERYAFDVCFAHPSNKKRYEVSENLDVERLGAQLRMLTDESENPENEKQVISPLSLYSPGFKLGRNVILADTPGLNAHGYSGHEDLTWAFLIPKVDLVIFLTTAKADTDSKNQEYLARLKDYDKPIVVAQNMKESVVEKIGEGGTVLKDKEEQLRQHKKRLQNLVQSVYGSEAPPEVFQISAMDELNGKTSDSGFAEFVAHIEQSLENQKPYLEAQRRRRLVSKLSGLLKQAPRNGETQNDLSTLDERKNIVTLALEELERTNAKQVERFVQVRDHAMKDFVFMLSTMQRKAQKNKYNSEGVFSWLGMFHDVHPLAEVKTGHADHDMFSFCIAWKFNSFDHDDAEKITGDLQKFSEKIYTDLLNCIRSYTKACECIAQKLNISIKDLYNPQINAQKRSKVIVPKETKTESVRVERSGFFSKVWRLLGTGGYEYVERTTVVLDQEKFCAAMLEAIDLLNSDFTESCQMVERAFVEYRGYIAEQIEIEQKQFAEQVRLYQQLEKNARLHEQLTELVDSMREEAAIYTPHTTHSIQEMRDQQKKATTETCQVSSSTVRLLELVDSITSQTRIVARDYCLRGPNAVHASQAVVIGWDGGAIEQFLSLFWQDYMLPSLNLQEHEVKMAGGEISSKDIPPAVLFSAEAPETGLPCLTIHLCTTFGKMADAKENFLEEAVQRALPDEKIAEAAVFLLVNSVQPGDAVNKISDSPWLLALLRKAPTVVLCLQSGEEFRHASSGNFDSSGFVESILTYLDQLRGFRISVSSALVVDADIGLSLVANTLVRGVPKTDNEVKELLKTLAPYLDYTVASSIIAHGNKYQ